MKKTRFLLTPMTVIVTCLSLGIGAEEREPAIATLLSQMPEDVIVEYTRAIGMLRPPSRPTVRIFGDNRFEVFQDAPRRDRSDGHWRHVGTYGGTLTESERTTLLRLLEGADVQHLTSNEIQRQIRERRDELSRQGVEPRYLEDGGGAKLTVNFSVPLDEGSRSVTLMWGWDSFYTLKEHLSEDDRLWYLPEIGEFMKSLYSATDLVELQEEPEEP